MSQRILYIDDDGNVCVVIPSEKILQRRSIHQIARKDVPPGKPYAIVNTDTVPSDRYFREAWEVDPAGLIDGVGNNSNTYED